MTLPTPRLDDRRAQDLVDEAKRRIARLVPDWTDHNVSDPGVALVELFAWMTELTLYRLNQVPDRLYVKFLELVGVQLFTAVPARGELLFRLTAAQEEVVRVPEGTQVSTERSGGEQPVVFSTDRELAVVPPQVTGCLLSDDGSKMKTEHWDELRRQAVSLRLFRSLEPDACFYLGFDQSLEGNLLRLDLTMGPEGAGVDPDRPPRVWEAWDGDGWRAARLLSDSSAGFNTSGSVEVLLPSMHRPMPLGPLRAHWVRCRLTTPLPGQPAYVNAPVLERLEATCVGGIVTATHAEPAPAEHLGVSNGEPGQRFGVRRPPVLPRAPGETVRVVVPPSPAAPDGLDEEWLEVPDFTDAREDDKVFTWNGSDGEIAFGPAVLDREGRRVQHGAVPSLDSGVLTTGYRHGGGSRGNVGPHRLRVLQTSIPFVDRVTNPDPTTGGVDQETVENAKVRGPLSLRAGGRAVSAHDFERAALDAARGVSRARCLPPERPEDPARLLIVPRVDVAPADLAVGDLALGEELERRIQEYLEPRRVLTARVVISEPSYRLVRVVAWVRAAAGVREESVREEAERALYVYLNPVTGGPSGQGWPFDRELTVSDIYAVLAALPGLTTVLEVQFQLVDPANPDNPERVDQRVVLEPDALFCSHHHRVVVEQ